MKEITTHGIIREIHGKLEVIRDDENIMRDEFHYLILAENGKYFLKSSGNVSPNRLDSWYVELSERQAQNLKNCEDVETFSRIAGEYSID